VRKLHWTHLSSLHEDDRYISDGHTGIKGLASSMFKYCCPMVPIDNGSFIIDFFVCSDDAKKKVQEKNSLQ
jgi:hypothetical protein